MSNSPVSLKAKPLTFISLFLEGSGLGRGREGFEGLVL